MKLPQSTKVAVCGIVILALMACAQLLKVEERSADSIAKGIEEYCKNANLLLREQFRAKINEKAAPHQIKVTCSGD